MKRNKLDKDRIKTFLRQMIDKKLFVRFLMVGASGLVVNNILMAGFTELAEIHYLVSAALATQGSTLWNFMFTERWVFDAREKERSFWRRLGGYFVMNNFFLTVRGPLLALLTSGLGIHYLVSNVLSLALIALLRFMISDRLIWSPTDVSSRPKTFWYDIHGIVRVESNVSLPELESFRKPVKEGPDCEPADIRVRIQPQRRLGSLNGSIRYDEGIGDLGFWIDIKREKVTEIAASPMLRRSPHVLYTNVVEPILRWTFVRKGYALIHGACLAYEDQALLVTARTDTGKTTTVLRSLSRYPFEFISDDMTILGADGSLYSYPKPLTISLHTLQAVERTTLTFRERLALQIQSRLHSRSGRRLGMLLAALRLPAATLNALVQMLIPPPKYMVERLIPAVQSVEQASLAYIAVIERGPDSELILRKGEAEDILLENAEDAYGFPPYPMLAPQMSQWNGADLQTKEKEIIRKALRGIPAVRLSRQDYGWWRRLPALYYSIPFERVDNPISSRYPTIPRRSLPPIVG